MLRYLCFQPEPLEGDCRRAAHELAFDAPTDNAVEITDEKEYTLGAPIPPS